MPESGLDRLERKLRYRFTMAREVLDAEGYDDVAALIPIEEVLIWIKEARDGR